MAAKAKFNPAFDLVITRDFDAPRGLVWDAWTIKEHALKWVGPRDHPAVEADHDIRPGGKWRGALQGANGELLGQGGEYLEVVPQEKLVYTFAWDDGGPTLVTVTFTDHGEGTRMVFRQQGLTSASSRDGHHGGWSSSFDRLDDFLAGAKG
jgi:uncharacterized protein YndB with AHSA1/START domain